MIKELLQRLLFASGVLKLYHRVRNRHVLTVVSLHRVIAPNDPRWKTCDPLYTLSDRLFQQCLSFFRAHYSVISLDELDAARQQRVSLPPRPLLITFDDGWADNFEYALPALKAHEIPAALFVASDAIDRREAFFQERIIGWWRTGQLTDTAVGDAWLRSFSVDRFPEEPLSESVIRQLVARLQILPVSERDSIVAELGRGCEDDGRQMLTRDELRTLFRNGIGIGTHGRRHEPLTNVRDLHDELTVSKDALAGMLEIDASRILSLSFPFSKTNNEVVREAVKSGYGLLFGGGKSVTPIEDGVPALLARVGITEHEISDAGGNLLSHRLANQLFRQPRRPLAAQ